MEISPAIITAGTMSTLACIRRMTTTFSAKTVATASASRLPSVWPASRPSANISVAPTSATPIAIQVRGGTRSRRKTQPNSAAKNGPVLISTNVLAAVFRIRDRMKKKNVAASSAPASTPGAPTARIFDHTAPRCHVTSTENRNATMKSERQKTISQPSVLATLRTKIPPVLQQRPAAIINSTPSRRLEGNVIGVLRAAAVVEREELLDDFAVTRPCLAAVDEVGL